MQTTTATDPGQILANYGARVAKARQSLLTLGHLSENDLAALQRERLIDLVSHHYYNPYNDTYRRVVQRHGLDWGEPATGATSGVFGRFFTRRVTTPLATQHIPVPAAISATELLGMLPIVDKSLLVEGRYHERPAVPLDQIAFIPASSGTTTGMRGYTALSRKAVWSFGVEQTLWIELLAGIDPLTMPGYLVAHFKRNDPADARTSATYSAFSPMSQMAPHLIALGSTQDTIAEHIAHLRKPVRWAFCSPHFFRQLVARSSPDDLRGIALKSVFWGGGNLSPDERDAIVRGLGIEHALGIYAVSEVGIAALQIDDDLPYATLPDRALLEVVGEHGGHVAPGETGAMVLTSLTNDATPILRFRIGDEARSLGSYLKHTAAWRDLGVTLPTPEWSERGYLTMGLVRHATFFDNVTRAGGLIIGDGKVSYDDVAAMQQAMAQAGTPVAVFQLAKRLAPDGRHEVVVRVEAPPDQADRARTNALAAVRLSHQLAYLFDDGELPPPVIEVLAPGAIGQGQFKVPPIVDETRQPAKTQA